MGARDVPRRAGARRAVLDDLGRADQAALHRGRSAGRCRCRDRLPGRVSLHPRRVRLDVPGAAVDDAPVRRVRHRARRPTGASATCSITGRRGCRPRSTCRPDGPTTPTTHARSARWDARASRSTRSTTWRRCFPASRSTRSRVSMTINAPAAIMLAFYVVAAERQGVARRGGWRGTIQTDILKEYIAQKEWCFPIDPAMRLVGRHDRVVRAVHAALAPDLDLRLPHPRGGLDRRAGARVHAQGRAHLRRAGRCTRARRRRFRAAAVVLLQRAYRLLRGDRQVPRGAADLGAGAERHVRGAASPSRGGCGSTPRRPACRSPPSSRSTTSCAPRSRRWPACSAGPSRCTPTASTRPSRSRPRQAVRVALAHAADHRRGDRGRRTRSTRSAGPIRRRP